MIKIVIIEKISIVIKHIEIVKLKLPNEILKILIAVYRKSNNFTTLEVLGKKLIDS